MKNTYTLKALLFSLLFIAGFAVQSRAQIQIDTTNFTICGGTTIDLTAKIAGTLTTFDNDFNNGLIGQGWSSTAANPVFNNPCGPGKSGAHLWVGTTPSNRRTLTSIDYDLSNANSVAVNFWMRYGRVQGSGNCEDPDQANEGVHLQYSNDNGTSWHDFPGTSKSPVGNNSTSPPFNTLVPGSGGYWQPTNGQQAQQTNELYYWNEYFCQLPDSVLTSTIRFRWAQLSTSNDGFDAWGIDEVKIYAFTGNVPNEILWTGNMTGLDATFSLPEKSTPYDSTFYIYNSTDTTIFDSITVTVLPKPDAAISSLPDTICTTEPVQFINAFTDNPGYTYSWKINQQSIPETTAWLDTSFAQTGNYEIELTVDNGACSDVFTHDIYVKPGFQMPVYSVNPVSSCGPTDVDFSIAPSGYLNTWHINPQLYSTQNQMSYKYNNPGVYHPRLVVTNPATGCQADIIFDIRIGSQPLAAFDASPTTISLQQPTVDFTDQSVIADTIQKISSWHWDFGDGQSSQLQNPSHDYTSTGNFYTKLTITTDIGCQATDSTLLQVVTGLDELSQKGLKVYPVPADNFIIIEAEEQLPESYRIYDITGRLMKSIQLSTGVNQHKINVSNLSSGSYLLEMKIKNKPVRMKFIKR